MRWQGRLGKSKGHRQVGPRDNQPHYVLILRMVGGPYMGASPQAERSFLTNDFLEDFRSRVFNPGRSKAVDEVAVMAITDPTRSVRDDIERLRAMPGAPDEMVVSGLVYDVTNGMISQVVPPAPLRVTT